MKQSYSFRRTLSVLMLLLAPVLTWAYDFEADGICYNITGAATVEVTYRYSIPYSGDIVIPSTVAYSIEDNTYIFRVTFIGGSAFYNCSSLTSIVIPESVTSIGNSAFSGCSSLTSIVIPNSVTSIGSEAFKGCSSLESINIPESVTSIGDYAFLRCPSLTSMTVSEDNPVYDSREGCNAIIRTDTNTLIAGCMNTIIPDGVTSIGSEAFQYCFFLTSIVIPDGVTIIGDYAFRSCFFLTSIIIPESVRSIGLDAFYGCSSLTTVICRAEKVPGLGIFVFLGVLQSEATLYVPVSALEKYKAASTWKSFGTILPIEGNEDIINGIDSPAALQPKEANAPYYTLDGKPTANPTRKGIYIKDGKKVMLR